MKGGMFGRKPDSPHPPIMPGQDFASNKGRRRRRRDPLIKRPTIKSRLHSRLVSLTYNAAAMLTKHHHHHHYVATYLEAVFNDQSMRGSGLVHRHTEPHAAHYQW